MADSIGQALSRQGELLKSCVDKYSKIIQTNGKIADEVSEITKQLKTATTTLEDIKQQHAKFKTGYESKIKSITESSEEEKRKNQEQSEKLKGEMLQQQETAKAAAETARKAADAAKEKAVNDAISKANETAAETAKQAQAKAQEQIEQITQATEAAKKQSEEFQSKLANEKAERQQEHEAELANAKTLEDQIQTLKKQINDEKTAHQTALDEAKRLHNTQMDEMKTTNQKALETAQKEEKERTDELNQEHQAALTKLREDLESAHREQQASFSAARNTELDGIKKELEMCNTKQTQLETQAKTQLEELAKLQTNFDEVEKQAYEKLNEQINNLTQANTQLQEKLKELQQEIDDGKPVSVKQRVEAIQGDGNESDNVLEDADRILSGEEGNKAKIEAMLKSGPEWTTIENGRFKRNPAVEKPKGSGRIGANPALHTEHNIYAYFGPKDVKVSIRNHITDSPYPKGLEYWVVNEDNSEHLKTRINANLPPNEQLYNGQVFWIKPSGRKSKHHSQSQSTGATIPTGPKHHHGRKHHKKRQFQGGISQHGGFRHGKASKKSNKRSLKSKLTAKKYSIKLKSKKKGKRGKSKKNRRKSIKIRI